MTLLVVEQDEQTANLLKAKLERRGAAVSLAGSAGGALAELARARVDAVVTDLDLPDSDGLDLVRSIRRRDATLPVVIHASQVTMERAMEGIRAGATDFLPKPVNVDVMLLLLDRWIQERSRQPKSRPGYARPAGSRGAA